MAGRTIYITSGIKPETARWSIKMELERFGKVDACWKHTGDRFNPESARLPWVKFASRLSAEKALEAMRQGKVLIHNERVTGEWSSNGEPPPPVRDVLDNPELNLTSRDIAAGLGFKRKDKSRSRSRSRRSRSRRAKRARSRSRRRRSRRRSRSRSRKNEGDADLLALENGQLALEGGLPALADAARAHEGPALESEAVVVAGAGGSSEDEASDFRRCPLGHRLLPAVPGGSGGGPAPCDMCGEGGDLLRCNRCVYVVCRRCACCNALL